MRPPSDVDEWGAVVYGLLAAHGVKPWEFGEMTWSMLMNVYRKGKPVQAADAQAAQARRALALAATYQGKW